MKDLSQYINESLKDSVNKSVQKLKDYFKRRYLQSLYTYDEKDNYKHYVFIATETRSDVYKLGRAMGNEYEFTIEDTTFLLTEDAGDSEGNKLSNFSFLQYVSSKTYDFDEAVDRVIAVDKWIKKNLTEVNYKNYKICIVIATPYKQKQFANIIKPE